MRLKIFIEDIEYRDALIETLSKSEKNVYIELIDSITEDCFACGTILLTDISESRIESLVRKEFASQVVILTACPLDSINIDSIGDNQFNKIFMFQNASSILSEIAEINSKVNGRPGSKLVSTSKYLVCGDSSEQCSLFSSILARQIRFRHGGTILVLSLTYINSHPVSEEVDRSSFARMMYFRDVNRPTAPDMYLYTDIYGISYLRLPIGNNPLAYMDFEELVSMCSYLCEGSFETLILDIGSEFSDRNQQVLNIADEILIVNNGGRSTDWNSFSAMNTKATREKIKAFNNVDLELNLDDFLREKYGVIIENEEPEENSKTIRKRDRQARNRG